MKSIINGIRYNTENANLLGKAWGGAPYRSDFSHWTAGLYRTQKSGRYFLAGEGGPMSRYARSLNTNHWCGGERIDPLAEADAFEWAQQYLTPDEVEAAFAHLIED
jgi:hypothetical protein